MRVFGRLVGFCCETCASAVAQVQVALDRGDISDPAEIARIQFASDLRQAIALVNDVARGANRPEWYRALANRLQTALDGGVS